MDKKSRRSQGRGEKGNIHRRKGYYEQKRREAKDTCAESDLKEENEEGRNLYKGERKRKEFEDCR